MGIVPVDHYSRLDNVPGFLSQYIVVHSVYILYIFVMNFNDKFILMVHIFIFYHFLFIRILVFLLCIYFNIIILEMILFI